MAFASSHILNVQYQDRLNISEFLVPFIFKISVILIQVQDKIFKSMASKMVI